MALNALVDSFCHNLKNMEMKGLNKSSTWCEMFWWGTKSVHSSTYSRQWRSSTSCFVVLTSKNFIKVWGLRAPSDPRCLVPGQLDEVDCGRRQDDCDKSNQPEETVYLQFSHNRTATLTIIIVYSYNAVHCSLYSVAYKDNKKLC